MNVNKFWFLRAVGWLACVGMFCNASLQAQNAPTGKLNRLDVVDQTSGLVVHVDTARLELPSVVENSIRKTDTVDAEQAITKIKAAIAGVKKNFGNSSIAIELDVPYSANLSGKVHASKEAFSEANLAQLTAMVDALTLGVPKPGANGLYVMPFSMGRSRDGKPPAQMSVKLKDSTQWEAAFAASGKASVSVSLVLPQYFRNAMRQADPELPKAMGGGSAAELLDEIVWGSLGLHLDKSTAYFVVQSKSPEAATRLSKRIPKMLAYLAQQVSEDKASQLAVVSLLALARPEVEGDQLRIAIDDPETLESLASASGIAFSLVRGAARKSQKANSMKQMMLAIHNFHSAYGSFPGYALNANGKRCVGLSWRVQILPFIEQLELYQQFHMDEPWDSPHNKQLISKIPPIFKPFEAKVPDGYTTYVTPLSERSVLGQEKTVDFTGITDGTSNTVAIVEVKPERAVPWTAPEEYRYDPSTPAAGLLFKAGKTTVGMWDGSVTTTERRTTEFWKALFTRNGGEVVKF